MLELPAQRGAGLSDGGPCRAYDTIVLGLVPGEAVYRPLPLVWAGVRGGLLAGMGGETLPVIDALSWLSSSSFVSTITSCWAAATRKVMARPRFRDRLSCLVVRASSISTPAYRYPDRAPR